MFQDNQLLVQLKQQLHEQTHYVKGIVKSTKKSFGFLEVSRAKTYFIPPIQMKKVMNGDLIFAAIHINKNREIAEPKQLIEPFLSRFIGRIKKINNNNDIYIKPDYPALKENIFCYSKHNLINNLIQDDWVIAKISCHPLKDKGKFKAEIIQYITHGNDHFVPWLVTLSRYQLEYEAPKIQNNYIIKECKVKRYDLTHLNFITIDSANTEDMDDALYIELINDNQLRLFVAIADPTSYIQVGSELDNIAQQRCYTNYLPGFNVPLLPRELSDNLCSLRPNKRRNALVCQFDIKQDGELSENIKFYLAYIKSKKKLVYDDVSDWLEKQQNKWQPETKILKQQILLLNEMYKKRYSWRIINALVFKDRPYYRFIFDKNNNIINIIEDKRRIANHIIEEAMIAANLCATKILKDELAIGVFNVHNGFDPNQINNVISILEENGIKQNAKTLLTLNGFCYLKRLLDNQSNQILNNRIRRFQLFAEIKNTPDAHYGLGFDAYATWTSPIRKYTDILNHRFLKAIINNEKDNVIKPSKSLMIKINNRKRIYKLAERNVIDWLYAQFLKPFIKTKTIFTAKIIDITRSGLKIRLINNGANAFIPLYLIDSIDKNIQYNNKESGILIINDIIIYKIHDTINVKINEIIMESHNIIAQLIL